MKITVTHRQSEYDSLLEIKDGPIIIVRWRNGDRVQGERDAETTRIALENYMDGMCGEAWLR